jgi:hypothetical protein
VTGGGGGGWWRETGAVAVAIGKNPSGHLLEMTLDSQTAQTAVAAGWTRTRTGVVVIQC